MAHEPQRRPDAHEPDSSSVCVSVEHTKVVASDGSIGPRTGRSANVVLAAVADGRAAWLNAVNKLGAERPLPCPPKAHLRLTGGRASVTGTHDATAAAASFGERFAALTGAGADR